MTSTTNIQSILQDYKKEMQDELTAILHYWQQHTVDNNNDGFFGKINNLNEPDAAAAKGVVLHARILWTFSAAYPFTKNKEHLAIADRAFNYLITYFKDNKYGGVYWIVDYKGNMLEDRKQMYGLAFTIYGMSEYYAASKNEAALAFANELYNS